jgi:SAM-dependent methyltransferase
LASCIGCGAAIPDGWLCARCDETARGPGYLSVSRNDARDGYDSELFAVLERLEEQSFWFRGRNSLILWALRTYFPEAHDVLEVGCGTGFVLQAIRRARPELDIAGAELFPSGLEIARRRLPEIPLVLLDARHLQLEGAFDVVGAFDVLEHVPEDEQVLTEMARAVRPGGGLLLTVPQHPRLWSAADSFAHHERRYRRTELVAKVKRAGLRVVRTTSFVSFLLPLLVASRLRRARDLATYDLERELRLPRTVDRALESILLAERKLIGRGFSFPVGGSLLVVATKS